MPTRTCKNHRSSKYQESSDHKRSLDTIQFLVPNSFFEKLTLDVSATRQFLHPQIHFRASFFAFIKISTSTNNSPKTTEKGKCPHSDNRRRQTVHSPHQRSFASSTFNPFRTQQKCCEFKIHNIFLLPVEKLSCILIFESKNKKFNQLHKIVSSTFIIAMFKQIPFQ